MLPKGRKGSKAILPEIYQNVHAVRVHRLAHVDVIVGDVGTQLLQSRCGTGLKVLGLGLSVVFGLEGVVYPFDVC